MLSCLQRGRRWNQRNFGGLNIKSYRFEPHRFLNAQDAVLAEIRLELIAGQKRTHWMWFVFPQLAGLGSSQMAQRYALRSLHDARTYLTHPVLGSRLLEFTTIVNDMTEKSVEQIFGEPDNLKFHASMTLFAQAQPEAAEFSVALRKYFEGEPHSLTIEKLAFKN